MVLIIGVRFRKSGKVYYFDPLDLDIKKNDHVIVETARGVEYGTVVLAPKEVEKEKIVQPLKPVMRIATPQDDATSIENEKKEKSKVKKQVPLRLSKELYDEIAQWAEDEFRSMNGQIEYLLTECVKWRKRSGKKDE